MSLKRITTLRHRVFRDFAWPNDLLDFAQFNLIYGWNGCGKTTLSSLFSLLEKRVPLTEGEIELEFADGRKVSGANFASPLVPQVRVFNRDFIATTLASAGGIAPIYFLGEESIEKQKEVDRLKTELASANAAVASAASEKQAAEEKLDLFCVAQAKVIKAVLTSGNSTAYNNYDKRKFRQAAHGLTAESAAASILPDEQKASLRSKKDAQPKPTIDNVGAPSIDLTALTNEVNTLVARSVVAQTLDELTTDPNLAGWVQRGLALHTGPHASVVCRFCAQPLTQDRRAALQAHFNDAFASFQKELTVLVTKLNAAKQSAASVRLPEATRFYEALGPELSASSEAVAGAVVATTSLLDALIVRVETKRSNPFAGTAPVEPTAPFSASLRDALVPLNAIIEAHNQTSAQFQASVHEAAKRLEASYVAEAHAEYVQLAVRVKNAEQVLHGLASQPASIRVQIDAIERAILEHRRPADELTEELRTYLGREELRFEVKETGYALTRDGQPVSHLSEGERTAIAFLYFLKSLQDKKFDMTKGIVVIDDPVSSLDANALFSAFGYMKERAKSCGQLIILTHSFAFFRLVKNWFHHLKGQGSPYPAKQPARFFSLRSHRHADGSRASELCHLDKLLREHESEYQYLFKRVHEEAHRTDVHSMEHHYGMPNVARRLLEAFLAFRFPEMTGDLTKRLDRVVDEYKFDPAKKTRVVRLLNTYSHGDAIAEPGHDLSLLAETQPVLLDLLDMMKAVDSDHYEGLKKLLARDQAADGDEPSATSGAGAEGGATG